MMLDAAGNIGAPREIMLRRIALGVTKFEFKRRAVVTEAGGGIMPSLPSCGGDIDAIQMAHGLALRDWRM